MKSSTENFKLEHQILQQKFTIFFNTSQYNVETVFVHKT